MARQSITRAHPYTPKGGASAGQTFYTNRSYRDVLAQRKGFANYAAERRAVERGERGYQPGPKWWSVPLAESGEVRIVTVEVRNSRTSRTLSSWLFATDHFRRTGSDVALREFRGRTFSAIDVETGKRKRLRFWRTEADLQAVKADIERRGATGDSGIEYASTPAH
jgi:hypothetical protein